MRQALYGALALVIWSVVVFFVGRATIPDRSADVLAWRDSATVLLEVSRGTVAAHRETTARLTLTTVRLVAAERAVAAEVARADRSALVTADLRGQLEAAATVRDTARVQAAIIASQGEEIRALRSGAADALQVMGDLRRELAFVQEQRQAEGAELVRLRASLAAGVAVTKPSRGLARTVKGFAVGALVGALAWEVVK